MRISGPPTTIVEDTGVVVLGSAQILNFIGAVVTTPSPGQVNITIGGGGGGSWLTAGNAGGGLVLGTTSNDDWFLIRGGVPLGAFKFKGMGNGTFILKTDGGGNTDGWNMGTIHANYGSPGGPFVALAFNGIPGAVIPDNTTGIITLQAVLRRIGIGSTDRGCIEVKVGIFKNTVGALIVDTLTQTFISDPGALGLVVTAISGAGGIQFNLAFNSGVPGTWVIDSNMSYQLAGEQF